MRKPFRQRDAGLRVQKKRFRLSSKAGASLRLLHHLRLAPDGVRAKAKAAPAKQAFSGTITV